MRSRRWRRRLGRLGLAGAVREVGHRLLIRLPVRALPGGWAPPVYALAFWLTDRCDLDCRMCWVRAEAQSPMSVDLWLKLADEVRWWRPRITLTGGEPSLHPGMIEVARGVKARGLYLSLNTNGLRLSESAAELVRLGLDDISVSLDGSEAVHDAIRGRAGAWRRAVDGIAALLAARGNRGWPVVRVTTVLSEDNLVDLVPLHRELAEMGVDCHTLQHRWFLEGAQFEAHRKQAAGFPGLDPESVAGFVWDHPAPIREIDRVVRELRQLDLGTELELSPALSPAETEQYYLSPGHALRGACVSRWYRLTILPDGRATPCLGFVAGSVRERPFAAIWNGPELRRFRRDLLAHGSLPACQRCCGMFSDRA